MSEQETISDREYLARRIENNACDLVKFCQGAPELTDKGAWGLAESVRAGEEIDLGFVAEYRDLLEMAVDDLDRVETMFGEAETDAEESEAQR